MSLSVTETNMRIFLADIQVLCGNNSVSIMWRISAELVPYAARLFLGSCMPSQLKVMPTGEGGVLFNYKFTDCRFKKRVKYKVHALFTFNIFQVSGILITSLLSLQIRGKHLTYHNELTYRPYDKSKPAAFVYPIRCVYKR